MDNFEFKFVSDNEELFEPAMKLAMSKFKKAVAWSLDKDGGLLLHWSILDAKDMREEGIHPFPFEMDFYAASNFALQWWAANKPKESEPDLDGSVGDAYEISNVYAPWRYQFIKIKCVWALYGK